MHLLALEGKMLERYEALSELCMEMTSQILVIRGEIETLKDQKQDKYT